MGGLINSQYETLNLPTMVPNKNDIFLPALLLRYFIRKEVTKLAVYITRGTMATLIELHLGGSFSLSFSTSYIFTVKL